MLEGEESKLRLEIAHVLFLDIVGYSRLFIDEQAEALRELNRIVRATQAVQEAEAAGELIRLPTGDGMALVFTHSVEAPVECALQISRALGVPPKLPLRMGIHSGPVHQVEDVNGRTNIAGAGINTAQRVMDCGDTGHILVSKRVADDLGQYRYWRPLLHELGEREVKHGERIALVSLVGEGFGNQAALTRSSKPEPSPPGVMASTPPAIAVLPLVNMSGEAAEYFADGMTEALITDLAKIGGLKVISRGSIMGFKGTNHARSEIARELGVQAIVEGSVYYEGNRVRVSARLVNAETDEFLWAERYDRELADVLALQDDVARCVAGAVGQTLRGPSQAVPRKVSPEVYLLDLRARHYWHQRTEASFRAALQLFEEAAARDPTYAPAQVGVAEALNILAAFGFVPPKEVRARSLAAVQRALALDPGSADAHRVLAFIHWAFEFNWSAAMKEYEIALRLAPHSPLTTYWFGIFLGVIGSFERSYDMLAKAQELDPLSLLVPSMQGWIRYFARRYDEAIPFYRQVLGIDSKFHLALWFLGEAQVELGQHDEAIAALEQAYELSGHSPRVLCYLGYGYGRAGREKEARQSLHELEQRAQRRYVPPYFKALVLCGLGDEQAALAQLEEAYRTGDTMLRDVKVDPPWDRLRHLPGFHALMEKMNYPKV